MSKQDNHDHYCQQMLKAALALAAEGVSVFPLRYRSKKPDTKHGFKDATSTEGRIRCWFDNNYKRNLAARTGQASGVWVLDEDEPGALKAMAEHHGPLPATRESTTGRGRHLWFKTTVLPIQSRQGKGRIWPGIDIKAEGGYVVIPPSIHPDGPAYRWLNDEPIAEAPSWLLVLARKPPPREPPPPRAPALPAPSGRLGSYGAAALRGEVDTVAKAVNGSRNHALNRASFCLHQLVAGGELSAAEVERALIDAATANGLVAEDGLRQTMATIRSGATAGMQHPRNRGRAA